LKRKQEQLLHIYLCIDENAYSTRIILDHPSNTSKSIVQPLKKQATVIIIGVIKYRGVYSLEAISSPEIELQKDFMALE